MTSDDILKMKQTLQAAGSAVNAAKMRRMMADGNANRMTNVISDENVKLRRTGPGLDKIRKAHATLRKAILARYPDLKTAFKEIDIDGSGKLRRSELRQFLRSMTRSIPDNVISALIDYVDTDQDVKTVTLDEFVEMMSKEIIS